jgi:hypothetical protein
MGYIWKPFENKSKLIRLDPIMIFVETLHSANAENKNK